LYDEFVKGPESISDRAARDTAMHTLQKMIRTWLDETYPDMAEGKKERISNNMDISLVEEVKEKAMRSVYNMNNVIRMSFIEAQFIKKEMMNALVAMDEMQASTNFNMNLASHYCHGRRNNYPRLFFTLHLNGVKVGQKRTDRSQCP